MKYLLIGLLAIGLTGCSKDSTTATVKGEKGDPGQTSVGDRGSDGASCTTERLSSGVKIKCGDSETVLNDGAVGPAGLSVVGPSGAVGATGQTGASGKNGSSFLSSGTGPTQETGENGDTFLNLTTLNIYKKENNQWVYYNNIKGTSGLNGTSCSDVSDESNDYDDNGEEKVKVCLKDSKTNKKKTVKLSKRAAEKQIERNRENRTGECD